MTENEISKILVNIFFKIHNLLGPGLMEIVYEHAICYELDKAGINYCRQKEIPVKYENLNLGIGFRADIIVMEKLIIEIKSLEKLSPVYFKQLMTYLKLTNIKLGLLVNFNEVLIKDGISRIANKL